MKIFIQMRQILHVILLFIALLIGRYLGATDIIGGSLRYEALGNEKYKIIGTITRNCSGSPLGIPTMLIYQKGARKNGFNVTRSSIKDISSYCKSNTSPCTPSNTLNKEGQEQHTFEAILDFTTAPYKFYYGGPCQVYFSMEICCRSSQTTNITTNDFYVEAMLDLCAIGKTRKNSNPDINLPSFIKTFTNIPIQFNNSTEDLFDNDSLSYEIIPSQRSNNTFETFIPPYSLKVPIQKTKFNTKPPSGLTFDSLTGFLLIVPEDTTAGAIVCIRTNEFRRIDNVMTWIGFSTKEIFISVINPTNNNLPTIVANANQSVCAGNKLCFTIKTKDIKSTNSAVEDTTYLNWNSGIPASGFTILDPTAREKEAQFCWFTTTSDARNKPYHFIVSVSDNSCNPVPITNYKIFNINVRPKAQAIRQYRKSTGIQLNFEAYSLDSSINTPTFEWQIRDSMGNLPLYKTFKQKDSFKFKDTGRYFITMIINNLPINCPAVYVDTVYMNGSVTTSIKSLRVSDILIYPNPTSGFIKLELNNNLLYTGMTITNNIGQVIYTGAVIPVFDMRPFAKGIYTIEIRSTEGVLTRQVIKE